MTQQRRSPTIALVVISVVSLAVGFASPAVPLIGLTVLAIILVAVAWPQIVRLRNEASWAVAIVISLVFLVCDAKGVFESQGLIRYASALTILLATIQLRDTRRNASLSLKRTTGTLSAYALIGSLYGRLFLGTATGALPIAIPLTIPLLGPLRAPVGDKSTQLALKVIAFMGGTYALLSAASHVGIIADTSMQYSHEKSFVVVLGIFSALASKSKILTIFNIAAFILAFTTYPAATYVVALAAGIGTVLLCSYKPKRSTRLIMSLITMVLTLEAVTHVDDIISWTAPYFAAVGKVDNGSTRADLYVIALRQLDEAPLFSHLFTGEMAVVATLSGRTGVLLPVHNDYLNVALGGGLIAAAMLIALFLFTNGMAINALRSHRLTSTQARTVIVLLSSLNALAVSAFANPILLNPGASVAASSIILGIITLCTSDAREAERSGNASYEKAELTTLS